MSMHALIALAVFAGAARAAIWAIQITVEPNIGKITAALCGGQSL